MAKETISGTIPVREFSISVSYPSGVSHAVVEREIDLWALHRIGLCFGLTREEMEEVCLEKMKAKRLSITETRIHESTQDDITK